MKRLMKYTIYYGVFLFIKLFEIFGFKLREDRIPEGPYCYTVLEHESGRNRIKLCPYYVHIDDKPEGDCCCLYEKFIGWDAGFCDLCKICGVNNGDNENYIK